METAIENAMGTQAPSAAITPFSPQGMEQGMACARMLAASTLMPEALRGKPSDIFVILMTGHELDISPMQAIRSINVIKGKAVMSSDLMAALVQRRSSVCEYFRLVESTPERATYETKRRGHPEPVRLSYTLAEAKAAGLLGKDNWRNHGTAMLRARSSGALARAVYPDLVHGMYVEDEGEEIARDEAVAYAAPAPVDAAGDAPPPAEEAPPPSPAPRAVKKGKPYTLKSQSAAAPTKPAAEQTVDVPPAPSAPGEPSALEKLLIEAQELATAQGVPDATIEKGTASILATAATDEKAARARAHKWIGQLKAAAKRAETEPPPPTDADAPGADSQE